MKKIIFTALTLLLLVSAKLHAQEFEYITPINSDEVKWKPSVYELNNGNFIVTSSIYQGFNSRDLILSYLSAEGELRLERNLDTYFGYRFETLDFFENENDELFLIASRKDSLNGYITHYKLDPNNLETVSETTHRIDLSETEPYSKFSLTCAIDDKGEGLVLSFVKDAPGDGNDSVFFWKLDYEGNLKHANALKLNGRYNGGWGYDIINSLMRNNSGEGYFYFTNNEKEYNRNIEPIGRHLDNDFNLISEEKIILETAMSYNKTFLYNMDVKQLPNGNFLIGADGNFNELFGPEKLLTFCGEFDEKMQLVDSIAKGRFDETNELRIQNQTPSRNSIDFIDENQIFFGANLYNPGIGTPIPRAKYFTLYVLDRKLNTTNELYYDIKKDETYLWINDMKATKDGGLICAGHFCDFVAHNATNVNLCAEVTQLVVKKFSQRAFMSIDEAHANKLKVALVYPNPGGNEMLVRTTLENACIELFDLQGKLIEKQLLNDKTTTINTSRLQAGTYLYKIVQNKEIIESGKWIKE